MRQQHGKKSVFYRQFQGGYAKVPAIELRALMEGYKQRIFRRNEVRAFAAQWEAAALHKNSRVSLYRIVNCDSKRKGSRRLSHAEIDASISRLQSHLPELVMQIADESTERTKPVARRVLRHVARGGATTVEGLFLFAYFLRRIPQRKPMQRLEEHEHYARFRYAEFEAWTGVRRATQSRLLPRLMQRGFLNTVFVHQQNKNAYGHLFIDGAALSLVRVHQTPSRAPATGTLVLAYQKRSTAPQQNVNTSTAKTSTLRKSNPRRDIQREKRSFLGITGNSFAGHRDAELRRIGLRAAQIRQQAMNQAA